MPPLHRFFRRRRFLAPACVLGGGFLAGVLVVWSGNQLASPSRRKLMKHHREFLEDPASHGLRIERFTVSDGTPCLICIPSGEPGARGAMIRAQLEERHSGIQPFGTHTGTLVLLHGRTGRKEDFLPIAERLCAAGFRCIIPDLPAHGEHPARTITYGVREAALPARVLHEAAEHFRFAPQPCGLLGMSMGGSVAIHAAALPDAPWKSLVIISSFDSLRPAVEGQTSMKTGRTIAPLCVGAADRIFRAKTGLPLSSIQPWRHATSIRIPTLMVHGTHDTVTSFSSGKKLFASLPDSTTKEWISVPGAGHQNVLVTEHPVYAPIAEWMLRHL